MTTTTNTPKKIKKMIAEVRENLAEIGIQDTQTGAWLVALNVDARRPDAIGSPSPLDIDAAIRESGAEMETATTAAELWLEVECLARHILTAGGYSLSKWAKHLLDTLPEWSTGVVRPAYPGTPDCVRYVAVERDKTKIFFEPKIGTQKIKIKDDGVVECGLILVDDIIRAAIAIATEHNYARAAALNEEIKKINIEIAEAQHTRPEEKIIKKIQIRTTALYNRTLYARALCGGIEYVPKTFTLPRVHIIGGVNDGAETTPAAVAKTLSKLVDRAQLAANRAQMLR